MEDAVDAEALQAIAGSTQAFLDAAAARRWRRRRCDLFGDVALQAAITAAAERGEPLSWNIFFCLAQFFLQILDAPLPTQYQTVLAQFAKSAAHTEEGHNLEKPR